MIEIIDNAIQLIVMTGCCFCAAVIYIRSKEQVWFLLTCFYGAYALGLIYWLLFIVFHSDTPKLSYVSDLSWLASVLFLIVLQITLCLPGERVYRPLLAWVGPAFSTIMCFFFFIWGDYFLNILWAVLMGTCGYFALRGLLFVRRQRDETCNRQYFHMAVLAFFLLEYCLWISSCYWVDSNLFNPYYWFDFLLTATLFIFMPILKKVVSE